MINYGPTFQVHHGRGSFDTSARFVVGDPGARFGSSAPLEYEVTEEIGRPHWELIFEHVLRHCGYLIEFHIVYVMVPILSQKAKARLAASSLISPSVTEPGELLRRSDQVFHSKRGG